MSSAIASTLDSSSGVMTSPTASSLSGTPKHSLRGTNGGGFLKLRSYSVGRICRAISSMSEKPAVVTNAARAVEPSMMAFVATVVAWTTCSISPGSMPLPAISCWRASMKPNDGSPGVESTLEFVTSPDDVSMSTPSVKVPPMSTPNLNRVLFKLPGSCPPFFDVMRRFHHLNGREIAL